MSLRRVQFTITQAAATEKKYCSMESKVSMRHEYISPLAGHVQAEALAIFVKNGNTKMNIYGCMCQIAFR